MSFLMWILYGFIALIPYFITTNLVRYDSQNEGFKDFSFSKFNYDITLLELIVAFLVIFLGPTALAINLITMFSVLWGIVEEKMLSNRKRFGDWIMDMIEKASEKSLIKK